MKDLEAARTRTSYTYEDYQRKINIVKDKNLHADSRIVYNR
jgi:hypothetical protein